VSRRDRGGGREGERGWWLDARQGRSLHLTVSMMLGGKGKEKEA